MPEGAPTDTGFRGWREWSTLARELYHLAGSGEAFVPRGQVYLGSAARVLCSVCVCLFIRIVLPFPATGIYSRTAQAVQAPLSKSLSEKSAQSQRNIKSHKLSANLKPKTFLLLLLPPPPSDLVRLSSCHCTPSRHRHHNGHPLDSSSTRRPSVVAHPQTPSTPSRCSPLTFETQSTEASDRCRQVRFPWQSSSGPALSTPHSSASHFSGHV